MASITLPLLPAPLPPPPPLAAAVAWVSSLTGLAAASPLFAGGKSASQFPLLSPKIVPSAKTAEYVQIMDSAPLKVITYYEL